MTNSRLAGDRCHRSGRRSGTRHRHCAGRSGSGRCVARARASTGDDVAGEIAARGGRARSFECDVSDPAATADCGRRDRARPRSHSFGRAQRHQLGAPARRNISARSITSSWEDHVSVGLRPCYWLAQLTYRSLAAERGSFVVLTSVDGIEGDEDLPLYSTVKAAQRGLVKSLAREWGPAGVRVNCLAPLAVTPALERAIDPRRHVARADLGSGAARPLRRPDHRHRSGRGVLVQRRGSLRHRPDAYRERRSLHRAVIAAPRAAARGR